MFVDELVLKRKHLSDLLLAWFCLPACVFSRCSLRDLPYSCSSTLFQSKLVLLKSFCRFLQHSLARNGEGETGSAKMELTASSRIPTWYFSSSFATPTAYHAFAQLLRPSRTPTSDTLPSAERTMEWQDKVDVDEDLLEGEDFAGSFALADISGQGLAGWSFGELESALESRDHVPGSTDGQAPSSITVGLFSVPSAHG